MDPRLIKYVMTEDLKALIQNMLKLLNEFISTNNEYISIKTREEKVKVSLIISYFYNLNRQNARKQLSQN